MKKQVGVVFGGRSVEHEVSIITAHQVMKSLDRQKYDVIPIYIDKDGTWYTGKELLELEAFKETNRQQVLKRLRRVYIPPVPSARGLVEDPTDVKGLFKKPQTIPLDVVVPATHGTFGEDGSLQGLLEMANLPYASPGVVGSAVGMDKVIMKSVFKGEGVPIVPYVWFYRHEWETTQKDVVSRIESSLAYPVFVKPANLGSSVGISIAKDRESLVNAIAIAASYDSKILVEQGVESPREINCSVTGSSAELSVSLCERPVPWEEFLSYEDKYIRGNFTKGQTAREIPAKLPAELTVRIEALAKQVFHALDARGVARVDFLIDANDNVFVNEINTIPGSFAFYLWEPAGISFGELLDRMIDHAFRSHEERSRNMYSYDTDLIDQFGSGIKGGVKSAAPQLQH